MTLTLKVTVIFWFPMYVFLGARIKNYGWNLLTYRTLNRKIIIPPETWTPTPNLRLPQNRNHGNFGKLSLCIFNSNILIWAKSKLVDLSFVLQ